MSLGCNGNEPHPPASLGLPPTTAAFLRIGAKTCYYESISVLARKQPGLPPALHVPSWDSAGAQGAQLATGLWQAGKHRPRHVAEYRESKTDPWANVSTSLHPVFSNTSCSFYLYPDSFSPHVSQWGSDITGSWFMPAEEISLSCRNFREDILGKHVSLTFCYCHYKRARLTWECSSCKYNAAFLLQLCKWFIFFSNVLLGGGYSYYFPRHNFLHSKVLFFTFSLTL